MSDNNGCGCILIFFGIAIVIAIIPPVLSFVMEVLQAMFTSDYAGLWLGLIILVVGLLVYLFCD